MSFDAQLFQEDMQAALSLLEAHGVSPAKFFVRQATIDAIKTRMIELGYSAEATEAPMVISGVPCHAWIETLQ